MVPQCLLPSIQAINIKAVMAPSGEHSPSVPVQSHMVHLSEPPHSCATAVHVVSSCSRGTKQADVVLYMCEHLGHSSPVHQTLTYRDEVDQISTGRCEERKFMGARLSNADERVVETFHRMTVRYLEGNARHQPVRKVNTIPLPCHF